MTKNFHFTTFVINIHLLFTPLYIFVKKRLEIVLSSYK